jgi:hypothetical protein
MTRWTVWYPVDKLIIDKFEQVRSGHDTSLFFKHCHLPQFTLVPIGVCQYSMLYSLNILEIGQEGQECIFVGFAWKYCKYGRCSSFRKLSMKSSSVKSTECNHVFDAFNPYHLFPSSLRAIILTKVSSVRMMKCTRHLFSFWSTSHSCTGASE